VNGVEFTAIGATFRKNNDSPATVISAVAFFAAIKNSTGVKVTWYAPFSVISALVAEAELEK